MIPATGTIMNLSITCFHLAQAVASVLPVDQLDLPENAWVVASVYLALIALGFAVDVGLVVYFLQKPSRWPEQVARLKSRPWSARQGAFLLLVLMALYFTSTALQPLIDEWFEGAGDEKGALRIVIQSISFHLIGLGIVVLSLLRRRVTWRDAFGLEPRAILRDVGKGVMFYLAVLPFIVFYTFLYQAVLRGMGYEIMMQEVALVVAGEQSFWMRVYLLGLAVVLAPLFEEILFRGIGLPLIARKWGVAPAVVVGLAVLRGDSFSSAVDDAAVCHRGGVFAGVYLLGIDRGPDRHARAVQRRERGDADGVEGIVKKL